MLVPYPRIIFNCTRTILAAGQYTRKTDFEHYFARTFNEKRLKKSEAPITPGYQEIFYYFVGAGMIGVGKIDQITGIKQKILTSIPITSCNTRFY